MSSPFSLTEPFHLAYYQQTATPFPQTRMETVKRLAAFSARIGKTAVARQLHEAIVACDPTGSTDYGVAGRSTADFLTRLAGGVGDEEP